jgi:hypothetical protein
MQPLFKHCWCFNFLHWHNLTIISSSVSSWFSQSWSHHTIFSSFSSDDEREYQLLWVQSCHWSLTLFSVTFWSFVTFFPCQQNYWTLFWLHLINHSNIVTWRTAWPWPWNLVIRMTVRTFVK